MRRAATSIPANIAEGYTRRTRRDYLHFLAIAHGSAAELESFLTHCVDVRYLTEAQAESAFGLITEVSKMLGAMRRKLGETR